MTVRLLIVSNRKESNVNEALLPVVIFLVGAERNRKSHWLGGVYTVGRYVTRYTRNERITVTFVGAPT